MLRIRTLGAFEVMVDDRPITDTLSSTQKALLFYLAWKGCPQERSHLAEFLWPERMPERSLSNLRTVLSQLRNTLGGYLHTTRTVIGLERGRSVWLDAGILTNTLGSCDRRGADFPLSASRLSELESAVALYQGPLLDGFPHIESLAWEEWLDEQRRFVECLVISALTQMGKHYYTQKQFARAAHFFERQVQISPFDEDAYQHAMASLALSAQPGNALTVYERYCALLQREFGDLPPGERIAALAQRIRNGDMRPQHENARSSASPPRRAKARNVTHLPQMVKPLLAREEQIQTLIDHARVGHRLISVVGMGGVGKTHLLTAALPHLRHFFSDGVFYIDLSGVQLLKEDVPQADVQHQLVMTIAAALGVTFDVEAVEVDVDEADQILDMLAQRHACLVLDNFETVIQATAFVAQILAESTVTVITGSRTRLKLSHEVLVPLYGLSVPEVDEAASVDRHGAVALYVAAAQRTVPHFALTQDNTVAVAQICRQVGGLPLALELAATWTEHFSPGEISQRIEESLAFLATSAADMPERQRSLDQLLAASSKLLPPDEARLLSALSVFAASFSRSAALNITGADLSTLIELVNKQWVQSTKTGHYFLHPLVKRFAREQMAQIGDENIQRAVARIHAYHHAAFAQQRLPVNQDQIRQEELNEIRAVHSDLCLALKWLLDENAADAIDLVCSLQPYWEDFGILTEAATWLDQCLCRYTTPDQRLARALSLAVHWVRRQPGLSQLEPWIEKAFELVDHLESPTALADLCRRLGWHTFSRQPHPWQERGERAVLYLEQTVSLYRLLQKNDDAVDSLLDQAYMQLWTPHPDRAEEILAEAEMRAGVNMRPLQRVILYHRRSTLAYFQLQLDTAWEYAETAWQWVGYDQISEDVQAWLHKNCADIAWHLGQFDVAWQHGQRAAAIFKKQSLLIDIVDLSFRLAMTAHRRNDPAQAAAFTECIDLSRAARFHGYLSAGFIGIGSYLFRSGQVETGAQLVGYGSRLLHENNGALLPWDEQSVHALLSNASEEIKRARAETMYTQGKTLSANSAFDLVNLPASGRSRLSTSTQETWAINESSAEHRHITKNRRQSSRRIPGFHATNGS